MSFCEYSTDAELYALTVMEVYKIRSPRLAKVTKIPIISIYSTQAHVFVMTKLHLTKIHTNRRNTLLIQIKTVHCQ